MGYLLRMQRIWQLASEIASVISAHLQQQGLLGPVLENHIPSSADVEKNDVAPLVGAETYFFVQGTGSVASSV